MSGNHRGNFKTQDTKSRVDGVGYSLPSYLAQTNLQKFSSSPGKRRNRELENGPNNSQCLCPWRSGRLLLHDSQSPKIQVKDKALESPWPAQCLLLGKAMPRALSWGSETFNDCDSVMQALGGFSKAFFPPGFHSPSRKLGHGDLRLRKEDSKFKPTLDNLAT